MGRRKRRKSVKDDLDRVRTGLAIDDGRPPASTDTEPASTADDLEQYLHHLGHLDMALPLKIALIRSVRDLMQSFVDRAFGDDPAQLALQAGGNWNETGTDRTADVVESTPDTLINPDRLTSEFRQEAEPREEKAIDQ
jgi:hypothetical protein